MKTTGKTAALVLSAAFVLGSALSASAQTFYLNPIPSERPTFGFRFMKVKLAEDLDESTFSGTYDFYADIPISKTAGFRLSLPYSKMSYSPGPDYTGMPRSRVESTAGGNVYLGMYSMRQMSERTKTVVSMGLHLPTASEPRRSRDAVAYGALANLHQARRVVTNAWVLYGNMTWRVESSQGGIFGLEVGPEVWIAEGGIDADPELLFHYGFSGGVGTRHFSFLAEAIGLFLASEETEEFGDQFQHHFAFGVGVRNFPIRPSLWYQVPLENDVRAVIDGVFGVQVEVSLPE